MFTLLGRTIFGRSGLPIGTEVVPIPGDYPDHLHDFVEVAVVLEGEGVHRSASGDAPLRRGTVIALRPGAWHGYRADTPLRLLNLYLQPPLLYRELDWVLGFPDLVVALLGPGSTSGALGEDGLERMLALERVWSAWDGRRPFPVLLGIFTALLGEIADAGFTPVRAPASGLSAPVRDGILQLAESLAHPWTLPELAERVHVTGSSLHHRFRRETGTPPLAWLAQFRAEEAATLLTQTDLPVTEIGRRVGWGDPNYLARRFRTHFGMSPTEFRRRFRGASRGTPSPDPRP